MVRRRLKPLVLVKHVDPYPMVGEAFYHPSLQDLSHHQEPGCVNWVRVERFRTTVERVIEPPDVYREQLVKLWRASHNGHDRDPLREAARRLLGLTTREEVDAVLVDREYGIDRKADR